LVRAHYRTDLNYSDVHLNDAQSGLNRLYTALNLVPATVADHSIDWANGYAAQFKAAMDEDFGTPDAVAVLFELATELNRGKLPAMSTLLRNLGACLGLLQDNPEVFLQAGAGLDGAEIQTQIDLRTAAKLGKNFAEADRIRQALLHQGIALKDSPAGTTWTVVQ
jgi:cysteinyl-tRNA synthetase